MGLMPDSYEEAERYRLTCCERYDEIQELRKALKKYGRHLSDCPYYHPILPTSDVKCTCGFEQALANS